MKPILLCDIDQVVVNTARPWHRDLELSTKLGLDYEYVAREYDFTMFYKEELQRRALDGYSWWKQSHIYDNLEPIEGSVETLEWASQFFDVHFVSVIKGNHGGSKQDFINKWFPFRKATAWTKEKWMCRGDIIIDDRNENLIGCERHGMTSICFKTPHKQYVDHVPDWIEDNWLGIKLILSDWNGRGNRN